ncbi:MAG: prolyl-tRNA synthetase associated domain-containing protein [Proteobacteria bacterium]|nr:prolyl-tRNA synthetase associated domain-containing protein [Pseudomonadota bacterium]
MHSHAPITPGELLAVLDSLGIVYTRHCHPPMPTVAAAKRYRGSIPGAHTKNLFLRDSKKNNFLLVTAEDQAIDLKAIAPRMGARRLSFASPDRLMQYLGVVAGAVTPFGLINDRAHAVQLVFDSHLSKAEYINCHPLTCEETLTIAVLDLHRFFAHTGHAPKLITLV